MSLLLYSGKVVAWRIREFFEPMLARWTRFDMPDQRRRVIGRQPVEEKTRAAFRERGSRPSCSPSIEQFNFFSEQALDAALGLVDAGDGQAK